MASAPRMLTAPAAGVMATRPATMPEAAPRVVALPCSTFSTTSQPRIAAIVARVVLAKVRPVSARNWSLASRSSLKTIEPTLKPYQPTHSRAAPSMVRVRLCGRMGSRPKPTRLPITRASTRPATPALMCTAVPPA